MIPNCDFIESGISKYNYTHCVGGLSLESCTYYSL